MHVKIVLIQRQEKRLLGEILGKSQQKRQAWSFVKKLWERCLKITEKVAFNIEIEPSNVLMEKNTKIDIFACDILNNLQTMFVGFPNRLDESH